MKSFLLKQITKYLFPDRIYQETSLKRRYQILKRIYKDEDILYLLRSDYTRQYKSIVQDVLNDKKFSQSFVGGFYIGRLFAINELISDAEKAEESLEKFERYEERVSQFRKYNEGKIKTNLIIDPL